MRNRWITSGAQYRPLGSHTNERFPEANWVDSADLMAASDLSYCMYMSCYAFLPTERLLARSDPEIRDPKRPAALSSSRS